MIGIYLITNKLNGKQYVGQSADIEGRWKQHINDINNRDYVIYRAMRKYGIENFSFEVLEECDTNKLDEREIYWISELDTYKNGYNMTLGGEGRCAGKDSYSKEYYKQYDQDHKEDRKQWYQDHKEEKKQYQKQYNLEHKEYIKQYQEDHKDKIREQKKQYYQDHKEDRKQYFKQYYQDHREEIIQNRKQYREEHKEEIKQYKKQYRLEKKQG